MENQKIENLLNLAFDTPEEIREKSQNLNTGYDPDSRNWEVIIRYSGTSEEIQKTLSSFLSIRFSDLENGYGILEATQRQLEEIANLPNVVYMEKPKRLYFAVNDAKREACILPSTGSSQQYGGLTGMGTLVGLIDSGIPWNHPDFLDSQGKTRFISFWDQSLSGNPPEGFYNGTEFTAEDINEALENPSSQIGERLRESRDISGHGTQVIGIAAGNGSVSGGIYKGVAWEADLIGVKLGIPSKDSFPRTTELMQAAEYVVKKATRLQRPLALNISFGNSYGGHDGNSLLETYLNQLSDQGQCVIVTGSGNEGNKAGHVGGNLIQGQETVIEFGISVYELSINIQIWKALQDQFDIYLRSPAGEQAGPLRQTPSQAVYRLQSTEVLVYYGQPRPYSQSQEIYLDFLPQDFYLDTGIWSLSFVPRNIVTGRYDCWLPAGGGANIGTGFLRPTPDITLTIPSTAQKLIAVGAYDSQAGNYASFSGRGFTRGNHFVKPDLCAPGVGVITTSQSGGYTTVTGTSFATPFVTGAAALLMEWGILRGNDRYLYGEKVKAYLIKGARQLPSMETPNPMTGWGALCVRDSIPV